MWGSVMEKIKVLHCVTAMNRGGLETFIMNYYRHIDRSKYEFDFLVQRRGEFDYSKEIKELGGHIYSVPAFNPFKIKRYNKALDDFFAAHTGEYDIVHAHNNSFAMYVLRAAKKYDYPIRIAHSHIADKKTRLKRKIFVAYNRRKLKDYCNVEFACGKEAGRWLYGDNDFIVVNNAIDLNEFVFDKKKRKDVRDMIGVNKDEILLGHIGRFEKQKNHDYLIEIIRLAKERGINVKLLLIGDGSLMCDMRRKVEQYGLSNDVIFTGVISEIGDYLSAMDVFVMPSFCEGFPVTLVEAQANGLPCLVSNRVDRKCKITPLVQFLPISDNAVKDWIDLFLKCANNSRKSYDDLLLKSGFGIEIAAKRLQKIYEYLVYMYGDNSSRGKPCF